MDQGSSLLLGIDGLVVDSVLVGESGRRVHCSTDPELAGWCPDCQQQSSSPMEWVTTRPRDLRIGPDRPDLLWHKRTVVRSGVNRSTDWQPPPTAQRPVRPALDRTAPDDTDVTDRPIPSTRLCRAVDVQRPRASDVAQVSPYGIR